MYVCHDNVYSLYLLMKAVVGISFYYVTIKILVDY